MLIHGLIFVGWLICVLVSLALSGSWESMVAVCCLVGNTYGFLIVVVTVSVSGY